jgi:hypothetical protein
MLTSFSEFPNRHVKSFERDYYRSNKLAGKMLNRVSNILYVLEGSSSCNYVNLLVCLMVQFVVPTFYIINYVFFSDKLICPNESSRLIKLFGSMFFFMLYAQQSNVSGKIFYLYYNYNNTFLMKNNRGFYMSFFVNNAVVLMVPILTYILFLEDSTISGFILNCMAATFLIEIDDAMTTASTDEKIFKMFVQDQMLIEFIGKGLKKRGTFMGCDGRGGVATDNEIRRMLLIMCYYLLQVGVFLYLSISIAYCL